MASVYTVAQVTSYISHLFEEDFALKRISIQGEISNCKKHSGGHLYFTLKDETSTLSCVMFASNRAKAYIYSIRRYACDCKRQCSYLRA